MGIKPMAKISAGVAMSHIPAIGAAIDLGKTKEEYWDRVFKGFAFSQDWIAAEKPDVIFLVYNEERSVEQQGPVNKSLTFKYTHMFDLF